MNMGTKVRTILRIAATVNTVCVMYTAVIAQTGINSLITAWAVLAVVADIVVSAITTYYNNDYTEIACMKTGEMRLEKEQAKGIITGENFLDEAEPIEEEEE